MSTTSFSASTTTIPGMSPNTTLNFTWKRPAGYAICESIFTSWTSSLIAQFARVLCNVEEVSMSDNTMVSINHSLADRESGLHTVSIFSTIHVLCPNL